MSQPHHKLPVPDVEGQPQTVVIDTEPAHDAEVKRWLYITLWATGVVIGLALVVFVLYLFISSTPNYMLGAASKSLLTDGGMAGSLSYDVKRNQASASITGDFLAYTDPTDPQKSSLSLSFGQNAARLNAAAKIVGKTDYVQTAGLGNFRRLIEAMQGDAKMFTADKLTQLSALDNQWYSFTIDDAQDVEAIVPGSIVKDSILQSDLDTIGDLYLKHQFMIVQKQLPDESINTINSMHLQLKVDRAKLTAFLQAVKAAKLKSLPLTDADMQTLNQLIDLDKLNFDVWIARSDKTFTQIRIAQTQPDGSGGALTLTFQAELLATQRQAVTQPDAARTASSFAKRLQELLSPVPQPTH